MVQRGLAPSRQRAQALILAGAVSIGGTTVLKAGLQVADDVQLTVRESGDEYVSRGGHKLAAALDAFSIVVEGSIAIDVGASTGGFTDVLLRRGAQRVYAVDVGYGQLAWTMRQDPRVIVMERTNVRYLNSLPEVPDLAVVDVSFISLNLVLPALTRLVSDTADTVALIKPQFEAGRHNVGKGGVVRDPKVHRSVLENVLAAAGEIGWKPAGLIESPIRGPAGNREFLAHLRRSDDDAGNLDRLVNGVLSTPLRPPE